MATTISPNSTAAPEPEAQVSAPTVEEIFGQCEQHLKAGDQQELTRSIAEQSRDDEFLRGVVKAVVLVDKLGGINEALNTGVIAKRLSDLEVDTNDKKVKRKWRFVFDAFSNTDPKTGTEKDQRKRSEKHSRSAAAAECLDRIYLADDNGKTDGRELSASDKYIDNMVKFMGKNGGVAGLYSLQRKHEQKPDDPKDDKKTQEEFLLEASERYYQDVEPIGEATVDVKTPAHDLVVTISRKTGQEDDGILKLAILDLIDDKDVINAALLHAQANCDHHLPIVRAMREMSYVCEINVSRASEYKTVDGDNMICELVMVFCHDDQGHATGKMMLNRTMDCVVIHAALKDGLGVEIPSGDKRLPVKHDVYVYTTQLKAFMAGGMKGLRERLILSGYVSKLKKPLDTHTSRIVLESKTGGDSKTISFHDLSSNIAVNKHDLADVDGSYKPDFETTVTRDELADFFSKDRFGVWLKGRNKKDRKVVNLVFTPDMWTTTWADADPVEMPVKVNGVKKDKAITLKVFGEDVWRFGEQVLSHLDLDGDITIRGTSGLLEFRFSTEWADYSVFIPEVDEKGLSRRRDHIRALDLSRGSAAAARQFAKAAA